MASESLQISADTLSSTPQGIATRVKFRVRFRKAGDLRLVSHHDLMHIFERTFRRADLAVPVTQGFNPRPRMWFALSLALGIAGLNEVLEIELSEPLPAEELQRRLTAHAPPGIDILGVRSIDLRSSARVRRAWYRIPTPLPPPVPPLPPGEGPGVRALASEAPDPIPSNLSHSQPDLAARCDAFMSQPACWIERLRPNPRRINLRPYVSELHAPPDGIAMALWITPNGAARPGEILTALGLGALLDHGAVIERTDLEIIDELPPDAGEPPVLENVTEESCADDVDSPGEIQLSSRPKAILDNPMSFDS